MPDSHDLTEKSDDANAKVRVRAALERGVAEIKTPAQARRSLDSLEMTAGDLREEDVACALPDSSPEQQAAAIEEAGDVTDRLSYRLTRNSLLKRGVHPA